MYVASVNRQTPADIEVLVHTCAHAHTPQRERQTRKETDGRDRDSREMVREFEENH